MNVLVTGGASGLGEAITRKFAAQPEARVYFTYSASEQRARELMQELPNTTAIKCDFKNEEEVEALRKEIAALEIGVLVNNAYTGDFLKSHFHKTDAQDFATAFQHNVVPVIKITQAAIDYFRKRKSGRIITVLTAALVNTPPMGSSVYVAGKAYLAQLSKVWATENARFNITSNTISPAFMLTGLTGGMDERLVEQMKDGHPLKKLLTTAEVAETALYLAVAGPHLNGVDIVINAASSLR